MERPDGEAALVARAKAGEPAALEELLKGQYERVSAVCRRMTGNDADAADATQEALLAIVRGLGRFDGRSLLSTWVYRVAVNASIDEIRRRSRRPLVGLDGLEDGLTADIGGEGDALETAMDIDAAMRLLPIDFRAAVVLRDRCGLDYAEIAEVLDVPPGTVRSRIARGRAALVEILGSVRSES